MQLGNWIYQTTTTTGAGNLTLAAATGWPGFTSQFAAGADGICDYFYYMIRDGATKIPIESGIGHMSDATTFVRDRVMSRNIAGAYDEVNNPVTLAGGPFDVVCADLAKVRQIALPQVRAGAAGRFLCSADLATGAGNNKTLVAGNIYVAPFRLASPALISGAAVNLITAAAGSSVRIGLYRLTIGCEPGGLVCETADIPTTGAAGYVSGSWIAGSQRLKGGFYYIAVKPSGGNPVLFAAEASNRAAVGAWLPGMQTTGPASSFTFGSAASAGAAMPGAMPALTWVGAAIDYCPVCYLTPTAP